MNIFQFDNYRLWLHYEMAIKIKKNKRFTVSAFAQNAGLGQSLLSLILNQKRNLTISKATLLAKYLKMGTFEQDYLFLLIQLESTKDKKHKNALRREQDEMQKRAYSMQKAQNPRTFSAWNYHLLLAATNLTSLTKTTEGLANFLGFSVENVSEALQLLLKFNLVKFSNSQEYHFTPEGIGNLPLKIKNHILWKISKSILNQATTYFETHHITDDILSGRIVATNPKQLSLAKEKIQIFLRELESDLAHHDDRSQLVQFSFQLFEIH